MQENLILFPLVANQSYRHSLSISSRCAAPICWISLTLSMPFPNALTNYYLQIGLFFLLHHSQSNISVFCLDFTVCAAPTRRTKEKSLERIIHSIINLHISQSDCTTYLLFLFMFFFVVYGIVLNYEAFLSRLLSQMVAHSVEGTKNLS